MLGDLSRAVYLRIEYIFCGKYCQQKRKQKMRKWLKTIGVIVVGTLATDFISGYVDVPWLDVPFLGGMVTYAFIGFVTKGDE